MSKISSDQQAKAATSADVLDRIFSAYEQIRGYGPDLNKNQFLDLYSLINLYPLDPSETDIAHLGYNKKHFIDAILTLKNQFALSLHQQLDLLSGIYLTPDKMQELIEQVLSDLPPFAQRGDQKSRANALYKCILDIGQALPLDALSAALYWKKTGATSAKTASESLVVNNDIRLENGLIYTLFTATLGQNATNELLIAIFFPSTFFVRKFLHDAALKGRKVDFIFHGDAVSKLIDHHYHYGSFADDPGKGNDFTVRANTHDLTRAGHLLFERVGIDKRELGLLQQILFDPELQATQIEEKDVTPYLFRRNVGTHLYQLGFTSAEIQYWMGYDIEDAMLTRNTFSDDEILAKLAEKYRQHPAYIFFEPESNPAPRVSSDLCPGARQSYDACFRFGSFTDDILLHATAVEPKDTMTIDIQSETPFKATLQESYVPAGFPTSANIAQLVKNAFRKELEKTDDV